MRPRRCARSARILFVWHTGEEAGLWGSRYFTDHPTVPLDHIVAQLNIDMIGRSTCRREPRATTALPLTDPETVYVVGSKRLSADLGGIVEQVNDRGHGLHLDYSLDDPSDPARIYQRSDHYQYAKHGIPIAFFFTGVHGDYHGLDDEIDRIDFGKMHRIAQMVYGTRPHHRRSAGAADDRRAARSDQRDALAGTGNRGPGHRVPSGQKSPTLGRRRVNVRRLQLTAHGDIARRCLTVASVLVSTNTPVLPFRVDLVPGVPVYEQLVAAVTRAVVCGDLKPRRRVPVGPRRSARRLRINPNTAQKAVAQLTALGLLQVHPGIGTRVAQPPPASRAASIDASSVRRPPTSCSRHVGAGSRSQTSRTLLEAEWQRLEPVRTRHSPWLIASSRTR